MTKRIHASVPLGGGSLFGRLAGKRAAGAPRRLAPEIYDATGKLR
jgi:hypothetical protein